MTIRVLQGDCRNLLLSYAPNTFDCVIADPPYGETSLDWDKRVDGWLHHVARVLKPSGSLWCFGSMRFFMECAPDFKDWKMAQDIVWEKHNGTGLFNDRFRRVHEHAVQFYRGAWADIFKAPQFTNDAIARTVRKKAKLAHWIGAVGPTSYRSEDGGPRLMRSVIEMRSEHGRAEHPTQKPLGILQPLIAYSSPPCGMVLDPFCGSGSTGVACSSLGRSAVLCEINPKYVAIAERRARDDAPMLAAI